MQITLVALTGEARLQACITGLSEARHLSHTTPIICWLHKALEKFLEPHETLSLPLVYASMHGARLNFRVDIWQLLN